MSFPRYPAYKDSGVEWFGALPVHWSLRRLKGLVDPDRPITYGIVQAGPDVIDGVPYVRPADMSDEQGVLVPELILKTTHEIAESYQRSRIRSGDLVVSIGPSFGKVMTVPQWLDGANLTQGTARVAVADAVSSYIFWVLRAPSSVAQWDSSVGGATFRALNLGPLAETLVPIPPTEEQTAIATFLDRETAKIDALVAEQERLIELLKEKRQAVISHAVTKGLDPSVPMKDSGVEWLGEVPAHWEVKQLRHIARVVRGASPRPAGDPRFFSEDELDSNNVPWVTVAEITKDDALYLNGVTEYLTPLGAAASQRFDRNTVIFSNSGATLGVPKILAIDCCANDGVVAFKELDGRVDREFLYFFLSTTTERLRTEMKQGGGQPNLNTEIVKSIGFALPPKEEQKAIVMALQQQVAQFNDLISEAQQGVHFLQERRTVLISAAVTGQIDVRGCVPQEASA